MTLPIHRVERWLPAGKDAAVVFSIDDVHPGRSSQDYDGGGDLGEGALGLVEWLLHRHPELRVTLFVTADWRETRPQPSRVLAAIPWLRDRLYLAPVLPKGSRRVDRAPEFVRYVRALPRTDVGFHGLHHIHRGPLLPVEFQHESVAECEAVLREMERIFAGADWEFVHGMCPPGWNAPEPLLLAMQRLDYEFVASARDLRTPIVAGAVTAMSGLSGAPLFEPAWVGHDQRLLHFTTNFQATSPLERALAVLDAGGLLAIKAHITKNVHGHIALDGVDQTYFNYLDLLFRELGRRYADRLWWTSMAGVARHIRETLARTAT